MKSKYVLFTVLAGVLWGSISIFLKGLSEAGFSRFMIMFLRSALGAFMLSVFMVIKSPALFKIRLKDIWMFLGSGVLSLTFFTFCYFKTIQEAGASTAVVLLYTSPVFVLVMSFFLFREKFTVLKIAALILSMAGCVLVTGIGQEDSLSFRGILTGIGSGFGYALYSIFGRFALKKYSLVTLIFYTFLFSALTTVPFCFSEFETLPQLVNWNTFFLASGISFFCSVLPYAFYTYGLSGLETGKAAIFVTVEPLAGCLAGIFLWKEDASVLKIIGIAVILCGIVLAGLKTEEKSKKSEKLDDSDKKEKSEEF